MAILDSGFWAHGNVEKDTQDLNRIVAEFNLVTSESRRQQTGELHDPDQSGHGTHMASVAASSETADNGKFNGIAPNANLVIVKAFDASGSSTYADVIAGIDWIVANRVTHNIRVINMSFSAEAQSHYWDDPLNQAVMAAWQAGIVVVASAGNTGPDAMTIGVPGNVPYVITVGAVSDSYTPGLNNDDFLTSFSAAGPTVEGFVKPELVAPGGHVQGVMNGKNLIPSEHPPGWPRSSARREKPIKIQGNPIEVQRPFIHHDVQSPYRA